MSFRCLLLAAAVLLATEPANAAEKKQDANPSPARILAEARQAGWQVASAFVEKLAKQSGPEWPGITAWLENYRELTKGFDSKAPLKQWPTLDVDRLVTHHPLFWRAYYEIAPGDPGVMALHAGLLLAGGESARALYVLVIARQIPGTPQDVQRVLDYLAAHAQRTLNQARGLLHEGIKLFDAGDYAAAANKYREQLKLWPQDGWADYELGLTLFYQYEIAAGRKPPELGTLQINQGSPHPGDVAACYRRARQHDPFQFHAYQGSDPEIVQMAMAMFEQCRPEWEKLAKADGPLDRQVLERFCEGCEAAGLDELALVARQVVVARRGRYSASDHPLIAACLRGLAPGPVTELTIKRLAEPGPLKFLQLVAPEKMKP